MFHPLKAGYCKRILELWSNGYRLTPAAAADIMNCYCLSQRRGDLRGRGHLFNSKKMKGDMHMTYWQNQKQREVSKRIEDKINEQG
jgi:hypothetical protein